MIKQIINAKLPSWDIANILIVNNKIIDIPINTIRPTHITNNKKVFKQTMELTKKKEYMDITIDENIDKTSYYLKKAVNLGNIDYITMSTDANGSCPIWKDGCVIGMKKSNNSLIHNIVRYLICYENFSVIDAIRYVTINPSRALGLLNKGEILKGNDALWIMTIILILLYLKVKLL